MFVRAGTPADRRESVRPRGAQLQRLVIARQQLSRESLTVLETDAPAKIRA